MGDAPIEPCSCAGFNGAVDAIGANDAIATVARCVRFNPSARYLPYSELRTWPRGRSLRGLKS